MKNPLQAIALLGHAIRHAIADDELSNLPEGTTDKRYSPFNPKRRPSLREMFPGLGEYEGKQA